MSGIYIKGMEMPDNCAICVFEIKNICCVTGIHVEACDRHPDCPLIEVQDHGRLIDADALEINDAWIEEKPMMGEGVYSHIQFVFRNDILYAPTVIPAEPPKEET